MPINSFQDIIEAMEQQPELRDQLRRHILTEELLQLPAQFVLLRAGVDNLNTGVEDIQSRLNRVEGRLGNIYGYQYEENAVRTAIQLASMELEIEAPRVAFSKFDTANPNFNQTLQTAVRTGLITRHQFADLLQSDLIIYGHNHRHAVVEISLGPNADDIARALRRSQVLEEATGERVTPVISTPNPHPAFIQQAARQGVHVLDVFA